jgi:hypothetical protein
MTNLQQLQALTRPQLIALTVQKTDKLYHDLIEQSKDTLIAGLVDVDTNPVQA